MAEMKFQSRLPQVHGHFMAAITQGMISAQGEYAKDMADTLSQEPHGRYYKNAGTPKWFEVDGPGPGVHRASAPGEPPAVLSGLLRDSIKSSVISISRDGYEGAVSTKAAYAALLEFGGTNEEGHAVAPRPAWLPTLVFNRIKYLNSLQRRAGR